MRRTRRYKFLQMSILFILYSIIHALSDHEASQAVESKVTGEKNSVRIVEHAGKRQKANEEAWEILGNAAKQKDLDKTNPTIKPKETKETKTESQSEKNGERLNEEIWKATKQLVNSSTTNTTNTTNEQDCMPAAIKQFPRSFIGKSARRRGAIIIHILVAVYTFLGLAIVCDEYFVASLDRICEELQMTPDVAGATFMAAGSSAPELATVVIGVFLAKDDIGISGVIGSAVFNIMFVIAVCALCTTTVVYLNWWPLVRDCFFYAVAILAMLMAIGNKKVTWLESSFMLLMYAVYCIALHYNAPLEKWARTLPLPCNKIAPNENSGLVSYKTLDEDGKYSNYGSPTDKPEMFEGVEPQLSGPALNQASGGAPPAAVPIQRESYRPKEYNPDNYVNPLDKPTEGGLYRKITWAVVYPIHFLSKYTILDCRTEKYKNWFIFTFFISMLWISFYSYLMVWMITIIGSTWDIPDTVMGLTFVAAGVSVPDALSSIAVMKEGYGDMAVSNAVGSNVFDILVCLGLPWFIKTALLGQDVNVISKGLPYSTLSLLSTVVFLIVATHLNGWKLDKKYGIILMIWYVIFITLASMYELNVFGDWTPVECSSGDW